VTEGREKLRFKGLAILLHRTSTDKQYIRRIIVYLVHLKYEMTRNALLDTVHT